MASPRKKSRTSTLRIAAAVPSEKTPPTISQEMEDRVILLLVSGVGPATIDEALAAQQIPDGQRGDLIGACRQKIIAAGKFHRGYEAGQAITRLTDLYRRSVTSQDCKTALAAQKELNKLLNLYLGPGRGEEPPDKDDTETLARAYLKEAGIENEDMPLEELCRQAAARIQEQQ